MQNGRNILSKFTIFAQNGRLRYRNIFLYTRTSIKRNYLPPTNMIIEYYAYMVSEI